MLANWFTPETADVLRVAAIMLVTAGLLGLLLSSGGPTDKTGAP